MEDDNLKSIARQLRKPAGDAGKQIAEKMNQSNLYINQYTITALNIAPSDHILEIGMGNGFFVKDVLKYDSVIYNGCDFSEEMVQESVRLNESFVSKGRASFVHAPADRLPFQDHAFDKIFTINTLYFWEDYAKTFTEIRRVLKPDGLLLIAIRPKSNMEKLPFVKYGFAMFSKDELTNLLIKHDFKIREVLEQTEPGTSIAGEHFAMETLIVTAF